MRKHNKHRSFSCARITQSVSRVSSQSFGRVQLKIFSYVTWLVISTGIGCSDSDLSGVEGQWIIDLPATQASLSDDRYMIPQTKAAAELSASLLQRHIFKFEHGLLTFGTVEAPRSLNLEYRRTENKKRLVFGVSQSPHLLRLLQTTNGLTMDFEGKTWYLVRKAK